MVKNSEVVIHHNYCCVFVLGNHKASNANRYVFADCSVIYLTGGSFCDYELSKSPEHTYIKEEKEGSTMERSGTSVQATLLLSYKCQYLLFCLPVSQKVSSHHFLLSLLHLFFALETWELTQGLAST